MLSRWQDGLAAVAATLVTAVLVVLDITDAGLRRWCDEHALTTSIGGGLLVLLITGLVVDQVVRIRQLRSRSQAVAVQVAIMVAQAGRSLQAVTGGGDRDVAVDEFRTYTMMLLAAAPVLIDGDRSRNFLEKAQHLDGEMAFALSKPGTHTTEQLDDAVRQLRTAATPLMAGLSPEVRASLGDSR